MFHLRFYLSQAKARLTILASNGPRNALQTMKASARSRSFRVNTRSALLQTGSSRTTDLITPGSSTDETGGVQQRPSPLTNGRIDDLRDCLWERSKEQEKRTRSARA